MPPEDYNTKCPTPAGYLMTPHGKIPVACNKWTCPHCGKIKLTRLSNRVSFGFGDRSDIFMLTITQREGSKRNIMKDWTLIKQRIERRHAKRIGIKKHKMSYFWVKEQQKNGQRHLHILTDTPIDWRWLKDRYAEITRGESFHIYVNEKNIEHAFAYVLKYLGKDLNSELMWKPKERKFGFCRGDVFRHSGNSPNFTKFYDYFLGNFWDIIIDPRHPYQRLSKDEGRELMNELYPEKEDLFCQATT